MEKNQKLTIKIGPLGSKLIFWGAALFLIGLIQGGLIPYFMNTRMALSAHLAAVQSGMALVIFGVIWELLSLKEKWLKVAYWSGFLLRCRQYLELVKLCQWQVRVFLLAIWLKR